MILANNSPFAGDLYYALVKALYINLDKITYGLCDKKMNSIRGLVSLHFQISSEEVHRILFISVKPLTAISRLQSFICTLFCGLNVEESLWTFISSSLDERENSVRQAHELSMKSTSKLP